MTCEAFSARRREALGVIVTASALPFVPGKASAAPAIVAEGLSRRDIPFNDDWRFHRGTGSQFEVPMLDDSGWRLVDLPHDWGIDDLPGKNTPFDSGGDPQTGFTSGGEGWYRKHFRLDHIRPDAEVEIAFDGAYEQTDVWLNGKHIGSSVTGYSPFALNLTPELDRNGENVLAVRVRNLGSNSRWYAGSGIYREVRLDILPAGIKIARGGVGAWTRRIAEGAAEIEVSTNIQNTESGIELVTRLRDATGRIVAEAATASQAKVHQLLRVRGARLWSPNDPYLYSLETELRRKGDVVDRVVQHFGIRIVTFDAQRGMAINGVSTNLRGGCVHHDNGLLGAATFRDADERRIRLLQARGFNAIRSSHNTSSRSLRETCDRLGMLLIEEAFDMWHFPKNPDDFSTRFGAHWREVLKAMVMGARNSPSVIMWSIGNEIPRRTTPEGIEWSWKLANTVRRLDPSRPVTAAIHGTLGPTLIPSAASVQPNRAGKVDNASIVFLDVPGYNYRLEEIEFEHALHPERVVYASETFARDVVDYGRLMNSAPYFVGEFLWTAMDYTGEAAIGRNAPVMKGKSPRGLPTWPYTNANCGDLDITGAQKPPSLARDVVWGLSQLEVLVHRPLPADTFEYVTNWGWPDELPSWTWPGHEGKPMAIRIFTPGDRVEVLLNGTQIATRAISHADKMQISVEAPYSPGQLEVIAYRGTQRIAQKRLRSVGPAAKLRIAPERRKFNADRQALAYIRLLVLDASGQILPDENRDISVSIEGPAELAALGNGDPQWTGSLKSGKSRTFRGQALAILRSTGRPGLVRLTAESTGLAKAAATLRAT